MFSAVIKEADPASMASYLRVAFDADKSKITLLDRGDFGSQSDMKPSRRSNIKFILPHRTSLKMLAKN